MKKNNNAKAIFFLFPILNLHFFCLISCRNDEDIVEMDKSIQVESVSRDSLIVSNDSIMDYKGLIEYLDTTEYIGFNDIGYLKFCSLFSCQESDSIVRELDNPKLALYAFHKLAFDGCRINTEEAIDIIKFFESSNDTVGVWTSPTMRGEYLIYEEAANAIWMNENFPMTKDQEKYVLKMRGF